MSRVDARLCTQGLFNAEKRWWWSTVKVFVKFWDAMLLCYGIGTNFRHAHDHCAFYVTSIASTPLTTTCIFKLFLHPSMSSFKRKRSQLDNSDEEEPAYGKQILPVANLPADFNNEPMDGMQYLFMVRLVRLPQSHGLAVDLSICCFVDAMLGYCLGPYVQKIPMRNQQHR